jgi:hypothetical protein
LAAQPTPMSATITDVMSDSSLAPELPLNKDFLPELIQRAVPVPPPARRITRAMYRILQQAGKTIDDSRIMLFGKMDTIGKKISGGFWDSDKSTQNKTRKSTVAHDFYTPGSANTRKIKSMIQRNKTSKIKSVTERKKRLAFIKEIRDKPPIQRPSTRKLNSALIKEIKGNRRNRVFDEMLKSAFYQIVGETNQDPEYTRLNRYYRVMFELYSSFTPDEHVSPLDIFNSSFIKEALLLHLIYPDKPVKQLLNAVMQSKQTANPELKGGGPNERTLLSTINNNANFATYRALYMNGPYPADATLGDFLAALKLHVTAIQDLPAYKADGVKVRKNIIAGLKKTIAHNQVALAQNEKKSGGGRAKYMYALQKTVITNYLKILFDGIYDACERVIKEDILAAKYAADAQKAENRNMPMAKIADKPCKIVRTIVRGCFKYVFDADSTALDGPKLDTDKYTSAENPDLSLYNSQKAMMINIARGQSQGGSTLDDNLMASIKAYIEEKGNMAILRGGAIAGSPFTGIGKHHIINNAATDQFAKLGLDVNNVICPMSSILDAMGSFGSCSTGLYQDNEKPTPVQGDIKSLYPTDIYISNGDGDDAFAYYGRTEQKIDNGTKSKKGIIQYGFRTPKYSLPLVIKTIDMTTPNVMDLSVSNTYESIINRMVYIWNNSKINTDNLNVNQLFELLIQNEGTFTDMISCSTIKSCGDVYQEINASFVNRGYSLVGYNADDKKLHTDKFAKTLIGIHKDRPAAARNIFLLSQDSTEINKNAFGGYASPSGYFFVGPQQAVDAAVDAAAGKTGKTGKTGKK